MKLRVLLTGATGMVGRSFLSHPGANDFTVLAPERRELDLQDGQAVAKYLQQMRPDLVIHCAGRVGGIQANIRYPVAFLTENLQMAQNVILAARRAGIKRLINLGSSCMYPRDAPNPLREAQILSGELEPTNEGYALAKIISARLCQYACREDPAFQYKTLIPCNLYGPHDKFEPDSAHLIAAVIHKIHEAKQARAETVNIWGEGTARREFLYVGDLADCLVRAVAQFDSLPDLMNVGLGEDHTVNEYYRIAAEVMGYSGRFVHDLTKPVGMQRKLLSTERAEHWGWRASTPLNEGIRKTYDYFLRSQGIFA